MYSGTDLRLDAGAYVRPAPVPGCVFVFGQRGVGKSTFARLLSARMGYGWGVAEISEQIIRARAQMYAVEDALNGIAPAVPGSDLFTQWREQITADKNKWRPELIALGDFARSIRPNYWIDQAIATRARIIVGVRTVDEVMARAKLGLGDVWVKVDRPGHTAALDNYDPGIEQWLSGCYLVNNYDADFDTDALFCQAGDLASVILSYFERLAAARARGQ